MKTLLAFVCLLLIPLAQANHFDHNRTYRACGLPIYPPISWVDNHQVKGVGAHLLQQLFQRFNLTLSFEQDFNWQRCLKEMELGHIDIATAMYKVAGRQNYNHYLSTPIVKEPIVLFYNRQHPQKFSQLSDLKDKTLGVILGDSYGDEMDDWIARHMQVDYVSSGEQNFAKLLRGRIDMMPLGRYGGQLQNERLGYQDIIVPLERPLTTDYWYIAIAKKSPLSAHLTELDQALQQITRQTDIGELMAQYAEQYRISTRNGGAHD
ncbi:transporter substrate-binding domain-containing protein [Vibrio sp. ABG19]|uniref:substrate-binding periplasmic protein n=1 Tax=Vibrio sp. ABG19 TaxID=2817385 RepID=UPI00249E8CE8|nr:transporter substrate-binding domain-containing protein [Vibrio sp. ABG19]WGY46633.1 transporter substrate-binding domain-containing protein [Vibrio sp. ABG19]